MTSLLVLGTADWNQPIATNQHYMVRELASAWPLIYTESMGLRSPEISVRDLRRMARRLKPSRASAQPAHARPVPANVHVRTPLLLPRHAGVASRVNRPQIHRLVADWRSSAGPRVLWTYTPVTYGLEQLADHVVYHCVDLLGQVDGIPSALIDRSERRLAAAPHARAIASSAVVEQHLRTVGFRDVQLWENVADTSTIELNAPPRDARVAGRAVFAGNLSTQKVDFGLLESLVRQRGCDLHLAGPISEGGGDSTRSAVRALVDAGATYHGHLPMEQLAALYWTASVGLIPYKINDYTRGVSPLKTYEYLAAGLGVVATKLPGVSHNPPDVVVTGDPQSFVDAVRRMAILPTREITARRVAIARSHSWKTRGDQARDLVDRLVSA